MLTEVKIILHPDDPQNKKGGVFESMIRSILSTHDYSISQNVNFTGLEIDLLAIHNLRQHERLYVECKAKSKPGSNEIKSFCFGVMHKKATHGYFIHTSELEHQAAGLKDEIINSDEEQYEKLTFIGPDKIVDILVRAKFIAEWDPNTTAGKQLTKRILALTHYGKFYIYLVAENAVPSSFYCLNADNLQQPDKTIIEALKNDIADIAELEYMLLADKSQKKSKNNEEIKTISEVATGIAWYDYEPTNPKFFVGRDQILKDSLQFFRDVFLKSTEKRVFYLEGKSGWGKSSFIARLRNRANSGHNKKKFFLYAVDYRSAQSNNFASIAFSKMVEKAVSEGFIPKRMFKGQLKIASPTDILSSKEVSELFDYLEQENKVMVLVFDQFEDAFRQGTLFTSFYKLLNDTHDVSKNLIVGFSWKSEINIPADHNAYYLWQQAKTNAIEIKIPEFAPKDLRAVTRQLENEIGKSLPSELKTRLIEISQGYPWLIKKLCIHVYEQIKSGVSLDLLQNEDMNIEALFKQDLEKLSAKESEMLRYIAKRAYDGKPFDISETDEASEPIIKGLIHRRLVVKSGTRHNIYWDIFRDYLVEDKVPEIGEIYLLRGYPQKIYNVLSVIHREGKLSINGYKTIDGANLHHGTYQNYFRSLKDLGIIYTDEIESERYDDDRNYKIQTPALSSLNEEKFKKFLHSKFKKYAPVLRIQKIASGKTIPFDEVQSIFKSLFRGRGFNDETIHTYTQTFISWLKYVDFDLSVEGRPAASKSPRSDDPKDRFLTNFPSTLLSYLTNVSNGITGGVSANRQKKIESDLKVLDLLSPSRNVRTLKKEFLNNSEHEIKDLLIKRASELVPINKVMGLNSARNKPATAKVVIQELPELFVNTTSPVYRKTLANVLCAWAKFVD